MIDKVEYGSTTRWTVRKVKKLIIEGMLRFMDGGAYAYLTRHMDISHLDE